MVKMADVRIKVDDLIKVNFVLTPGEALKFAQSSISAEGQFTDDEMPHILRYIIWGHENNLGIYLPHGQPRRQDVLLAERHGAFNNDHQYVRAPEPTRPKSRLEGSVSHDELTLDDWLKAILHETTVKEEVVDEIESSTVIAEEGGATTPRYGAASSATAEGPSEPPQAEEPKGQEPSAEQENSAATAEDEVTPSLPQINEVIAGMKQ